MLRVIGALRAFRLSLAPNWWEVLRRAWSIRLMLLAGILSGLEAALPLFSGVLPIPPGVFAALTGLTVAAAFIARLVAQKGLSNAPAKDQVE